MEHIYALSGVQKGAPEKLMPHKNVLTASLMGKLLLKRSWLYRSTKNVTGIANLVESL